MPELGDEISVTVTITQPPRDDLAKLPPRVLRKQPIIPRKRTTLDDVRWQNLWRLIGLLGQKQYAIRRRFPTPLLDRKLDQSIHLMGELTCQAHPDNEP